MKLKKLLDDPVCHVAFRGIRGALIGIFAGLFLGLLIWGLLTLVDTVFPVESNFTALPPNAIAFLGMGFGALIGAIFGSCACIKEMNHDRK